MFNKNLDVIIYTTFEQLITDKVINNAKKPEQFGEVKTESMCPFSKFAKYMPFRNIKHCSGINKFFDRTLLLNSWSDFYLKANDDFVEYLVPAQKYEITEHKQEQFRPLYEKMIAPKLVSPFIVKLPTGTTTIFTEAFYHYKNGRKYKDFKIPSGVITHSYSPHVIGMMESEKEVFINYLDPLAYLTIVTDKKIKINYELISNESFNNKRRQLAASTFIDGSRHIFNG